MLENLASVATDQSLKILGIKWTPLTITRNPIY